MSVLCEGARALDTEEVETFFPTWAAVGSEWWTLKVTAETGEQIEIKVSSDGKGKGFVEVKVEGGK